MAIEGQTKVVYIGQNMSEIYKLYRGDDSYSELIYFTSVYTSDMDVKNHYKWAWSLTDHTDTPIK